MERRQTVLQPMNETRVVAIVQVVGSDNELMMLNAVPAQGCRALPVLKNLYETSVRFCRLLHSSILVPSWRRLNSIPPAPLRCKA
jgi:hypothetical protein